MSEIDEIWLEKAKEIEEKSGWDCGNHDDKELQEHIEKCYGDMLASYIGEENNYVVDGAKISCDQMSDKTVYLSYKDGKTKLYFDNKNYVIRNSVLPDKSPLIEDVIESNNDSEDNRKLFAVHATESSDNGIHFATVADRTCLREVEENSSSQMDSSENEELTCLASIVSCGNCKILRESDIDEIEKRLDKSKKYGTCYSLIKPALSWRNPLCAESVTGDCVSNMSGSSTGVIAKGAILGACAAVHQHNMRFSTKYGQKEGITMLSTLLCTRGGVITVEWSGQIVILNDDKEKFDNIQEFKARYEKLIKELIEEYGIEMDVEVIGKIIYVESKGTGYDEEGRLTIRFENHIFLGLISGNVEKEREFYTYFQCEPENWRNHKIMINGEFVSLHSYELYNYYDLQNTALEYALQIDSKAAYEAISMGVGQIMGENYAAAGYDSAEEMYNQMSEGYSQQIEGMLKYIKSNELDEINDPYEFFSRYNGPGNVEEYMKEYNSAEW